MSTSTTINQKPLLQNVTSTLMMGCQINKSGFTTSELFACENATYTRAEENMEFLTSDQVIKAYATDSVTARDLSGLSKEEKEFLISGLDMNTPLDTSELGAGSYYEETV